MSRSLITDTNYPTHAHVCILSTNRYPDRDRPASRIILIQTFTESGLGEFWFPDNVPINESGEVEVLCVYMFTVSVKYVCV